MPDKDDVAGVPTDDPPSWARSFIATITIIDSTTEIKNPSKMLLSSSVGRASGTVTWIVPRTSPDNGGAVEQNPTTVGTGLPL